VLGFFFPDHFPVWDTAWVKTALAAASETPLPCDIEDRLEGDDAALEYARYVYLMIKDSSATPAAEYRNLKTECIRQCKRVGYDKPEEALREFYSDLTPLLFEVCLLGSMG
jgi:hypothetical protein